MVKQYGLGKPESHIAFYHSKKTDFLLKRDFS